MLDLFVDLARRKTARGMTNPLAENAITQVAVPEDYTLLASAQTYLVQTLREIETAAPQKGDLTIDQRMRIRAAGTFAIRQATKAADRLYEMAGTTAVFDGNPFERRFHDAHTILQHLPSRSASTSSAFSFNPVRFPTTDDGYRRYLAVYLNNSEGPLSDPLQSLILH
ncbi:MAG: hypothetical protein J2P48_21155 [Alphaproteobacteria bacterium]|nr:hypothetical protein [Alphaproteobacteria bacterium]